MIYSVINDLLSAKISGEWGTDPVSDKCVKILRTTNFTNGGKLNLDNVVEREVDLEKVQKKQLRKGDIIIEKSGGSPKQPVGRVVFFDINNEGTYLCNNFTSILRPAEKVYPKYLFYCLFAAHLNGRTLAYQNKTTGIINFQLDRYLKSERVPLPSLEEQKRIVQQLDAADALRQKRKEAIALLDDYLKAVFWEMFGGPRSNSKQFETKKLGDIFTISSGSTPSRDRSEFYEMGTIPWVKTGEVCGKVIIDTEEKITRLGLENSSCKIYPKGSVLIAMYGQGITRGRCGLLAIEATTNQACCVIQPNDAFDMQFVFHFLKFSYDDLRSLGRGGNQPNLNVGMIKNYQIIVPPIELQNKFAEVVQRVEKLKQSMLIQHEQLELNFSALIAKQPVKQKQKRMSGREYTFGLMQGIAAIVEAFGNTQVQYGEMVTAKFLYFLQEIFKLPFGIQFVKNNFGPYNPDIKKAIESGISKNKYFSRRNDRLVLGEKANTILKEKYSLVSPSRDAMNALLVQLRHAKSERIELIATICKAIQDTQSTDLETLQRTLVDWKTPGANGHASKADKFSDSVTIETELETIIRLGWDKALLTRNDQ